MSDVAEFKRSIPPYEPPKSKLGEDEWILKICAEWRASRAQQQKVWAERQGATMWGVLPDDGRAVDTKALERMKDLEELLARVKPQTMLLARELLRIAMTILAYQGEADHPETYFGNGPVLEIVRNVVASLEHCEPEMRIGG
jgi:hypothetical protein